MRVRALGTLISLMIAAVLAVSACSGSGADGQPAGHSETAQGQPPANPPDTADAQIEKEAARLLSQMTIEEKIDQMTGDIRILSDETLDLITAYNSKPITTADNIRLGIPGIRFSDGTKGLGVGNSTCFPVAIARGATWDVVLEAKVGDAIGVEARSQDVNFFGGLCINVLRHPAWGRAQETYGEDPYHLGEMGSAMLGGAQGHVMGCVKHFALNSIENSRLHVDVEVDERTLREIYLPHFRKCVWQGAASVMSAYNKVNGDYCGQNEYLLRGILKGEWGFKGFVMSDFFWGTHDSEKAAKAGLDIEMPFRLFYYHFLPDHVKEGQVSMSAIDDAVLRILRQKLRFSRIGQPERYGPQAVASPEHAMLARRVAQESVVLLKNEPGRSGKPLLPVTQPGMRIALIGRLADTENIGDTGSSIVRPPYVVTMLEGMRDAAKDGFELVYDPGKSLASAAAAASSADIAVVVAGYTSGDEGEYIPFIGGGDRKSLCLPQQDEAMINAVADANPDTAVIMVGGGPIITERWKGRVPAILMAWYPGMEGGNAVADIIFGKVNPSGKLPCVFPKSTSQLPDFDNKASKVTYGYYHGYRLMDKMGYEPAYPFGFGLSYTSFSYSNLRLDRDSIGQEGSIKVSVDITNTGAMAGRETAQLYIGYDSSGPDRPVKDMRGFEKVMLMPGQTKTVEFMLKAGDLAYYDAGKRAWIVRPAGYGVLVGPSSRDEDLLSAVFSVTESD